MAVLGPARAQPLEPKLRELSTDRPDATESPFTVDARHVQIEMHGVGFTRDNAAGVRTTEWEIAPFNLRYGLTPNTEAGLFFSPYVQIEEKAGATPVVRRRGVGDTTLRLKMNFWGNDGGASAFGVITDLKFPTASAGIGNDKVEAAVILPVAYELGHGWEGGMMTGVERRFTDAARYRAVWINTITFAHDLSEQAGGFLELTSESGAGPHAATFDAGITYRVGPNVQFDAGINLGLSRAAPDLGLFVGLSKRF